MSIVEMATETIKRLREENEADQIRYVELVEQYERATQALEAAKLREAELQREIAETIGNHTVAGMQLVADKLALTQERDAALSALEIARTALSEIHSITVLPERETYVSEAANTALEKIATPSAALAEHDRAIVKRGEKVIYERWSRGDYSNPMAEAILEDYRREFGLETAS